MAEVVRTMTEQESRISGVHIYKNATALDGDDSTDPVIVPHYSDKTIQLYGNFDTGTATLQGANDTSSPTWATLHKPDGNNLTMTAAGINQILENPYQIRVVMTSGGASCAVTAVLIVSTTARR